MGESTALIELVQLGRVLASATSPGETHAALADAASKSLGVDAAAVLRVRGDRLVLVATHGLPELGSWEIDADELDTVGSRLASATGTTSSLVLMLVVGGDIYGALVLLARGPIEMTPQQQSLAEAIVDLAATATERAERHAELARSHAELKASREALARTERLRILGQMAAGISHDVKNILNPLGLQLEVLRRRTIKGDVEGVNATLDTMRDVIRHGVDVVERLRDFSRQTPEIPEPVDVKRVIETAVELSRPRVAQHSGVALLVEEVPDLRVHARASELATALVNLIVNATEAMPPDGGTIRISAGVLGNEVWIKVVDDGPGMPPEIADNVFEPFFTTKADGTGLGLAMIYAFVQRFAGRVTLESCPGDGSAFCLWFPIAH